GAAMLLCGFVPVDRTNRDQARKATEQAVELLKRGSSFAGFPEGTRSPDGRLQPFKKGLFVMAIKAGALVVPISVSCGSRIMPKGKFTIHPGVVRVTIHEPIRAASFTLERRDELSGLARQAILKGLDPEEWPPDCAPTRPAFPHRDD